MGVPSPAVTSRPTRLGETSWPDVTSGSILALPVGSCEQHGPHLPLDTDTRIAVALAEALATLRRDVMVAPPVAYGASGEHAAFAGTLSTGHEALALVLTELGRSADHFDGVVIVNAHGGNAEAVRRAVASLEGEGRRALAWWPALEGIDAHAGYAETSMMLAIAHVLVRLDRAEAGNVTPLRELWPTLTREGVAAVSPNGVLGDPSGASATEGRRLLVRLTADLDAAVTAWRARW
jgi:mycofactocin system creatininase family protein